MAPRKVVKASSEISNPNTDIITDTSPRSQNTMKTWTQVFNILEYELINCPDDSSNEEIETQATKYKIIAQSELHKIATWPRLIPYNDMDGWVLENVDLSTTTICNLKKVVIGSFRSKHF
jgi:hypothetical protein